MNSNSPNFYPIINLTADQSLLMSAKDYEHFYIQALDAIAASPHTKVEFSLNTPCLFESLQAIFDHNWTDSKLEISFGSITSVTQLEELAHCLQLMDFKSDKKLELFSPCFVEEVFNYINKNEFCKTSFDYIPAAYREKEIDYILEKFPSCAKLKIFPSVHTDNYNFFKTLCGPYPELKKIIHRSRVLRPSEKILADYPVEDSRLQSKNISKVSSAFEYQKVRSRFLISLEKKLFIRSEKSDIAALVLNAADKGLKQFYFTGFAHGVKTDFFAQIQKELAAKGQELDLASLDLSIGTRVFNNVYLDLLAGHIRAEEVKKLMTSELDANFAK